VVPKATKENIDGPARPRVPHPQPRYPNRPRERHLRGGGATPRAPHRRVRSPNLKKKMKTGQLMQNWKMLDQLKNKFFPERKKN